MNCGVKITQTGDTNVIIESKLGTHSESSENINQITTIEETIIKNQGEANSNSPKSENNQSCGKITCSAFLIIAVIVLITLLLKAFLPNEIKPKPIVPTLTSAEKAVKATQVIVNNYSATASTQISKWKQKCKDMTDAQRTYYKPMTSLVGTKVNWGGEVREVKSSDDGGILQSLIEIGALTTEVLTGWDMTSEGAPTYSVYVRFGFLDYVNLRNVPEKIALKLSEGDKIVFEGMLFESGLSDTYCDLYDVQFLGMK